MAELEVREVVRQDAERLFRWANDPTVRARSISTESISWDDHIRWFERALSDPERRLYVLEFDGEPAGQIRFDREDGRAVVSVTLDATKRGHGLGPELIRRGIDLAREALGVDRFVALVRPDNERSRRSFERCGFDITGHEVREGTDLLRMEHGPSSDATPDGSPVASGAQDPALEGDE